MAAEEGPEVDSAWTCAHRGRGASRLIGGQGTHTLRMGRAPRALLGEQGAHIMKGSTDV